MRCSSTNYSKKEKRLVRLQYRQSPSIFLSLDVGPLTRLEPPIEKLDANAK